ncbi:hypothetical protein FJZ19_04920 [Candidatus Pacearchaeota archaeon]|nr:hypothetical protein [Candidatus Pacearchaeota archaeon]
MSFKKLDDIVMKGVNAGVHAWNWTTGRGKADLSNLLFAGGMIASDAGLIIASNYLIAGLLIPLQGIAIPSCILTNKKVEKSEMKALNSGALDPGIEKIKYLCKFFGYTTGIISVAATAITQFSPVDLEKNPNSYNKQIGSLITGAGGLMMGSAFQVMRSDYLPPRKNVVRRAYERASEYAKKLSEAIQPQPQAQPGLVSAFYGGKEDELI